ncbi:hypothetical protein Tco_1107503 [Tanacetum coccineum]
MIYSGSATKLLFALLHSSSTQLESYFTKSTSSFKAEKTTQQQDGSSSSGYAADAERARDDKAASDKENVAELTPSLYNTNEMGKDLLSNHKIISEEELTHEAEKHLKVKRKSLLLYHGFVYGETQFEEPPKVPSKKRQVNLKKYLEQAQLVNYDPKLWNSLPIKYFCFVKHSMLNFEKQIDSNHEIKRDEFFTPWNHDNAVMEKVHKRLFEEFKPLARDINLQLNCIEKSLVKEMKDDLKYVMSFKDELDETCLILDI